MMAIPLSLNLIKISYYGHVFDVYRFEVLSSYFADLGKN